MCGIAGYIGYDPRLDESLLERMKSALSHRGPDDAGVESFVTEAADGRPLRVGLAHTRLSILDLSSAGHQPMMDESEKGCLVYNGEIYNSPKMRREMKEQGIAFHSTSDTEVLLHLCINRPFHEALPQLNGMFAFAFYDRRNSSMTLARDRAGQKPLYYLSLSDSSIVFASEIPALLKSGLVDVEMLDIEALDQFWTFGYTAGESTFYQDIKRLRPGCTLCWTERDVACHSYWDITFDESAAGNKSLADMTDELEALIEDAVKLRLLSDVPVALCLSGGIDSAVMAAMLSKNRSDIPAYTISFPGTPEDEASAAAAVAQHLGLDHKVLNVGEGQFAEFAAISKGVGEPFGDASMIPTWYLSRAIKEFATVAITGDAGDELFAGYTHYREALQWLGKVSEVGGRKSEVGGLRSEVRGLMAKLLYRARGKKNGYVHYMQHSNHKLRKSIYSSAAYNSIDHTATLGTRFSAMNKAYGELAVMQQSDFNTYLTDDVLVKVDRMSMAHALECRSPFLDYRVIEYAAKLPFEAKVNEAGQGKVILRRILDRHMPRELYDRPKQGFTPPWAAWCEKGLREAMRRQWKESPPPLMNEQALDVLVPERGPLSPVLSWMAYSYMLLGS